MPKSLCPYCGLPVSEWLHQCPRCKAAIIFDKASAEQPIKPTKTKKRGGKANA